VGGSDVCWIKSGFKYANKICQDLAYKGKKLSGLTGWGPNSEVKGTGDPKACTALMANYLTNDPDENNPTRPYSEQFAFAKEWLKAAHEKQPKKYILWNSKPASFLGKKGLFNLNTFQTKAAETTAPEGSNEKDHAYLFNAPAVSALFEEFARLWGFFELKEHDKIQIYGTDFGWVTGAAQLYASLNGADPTQKKIYDEEIFRPDSKRNEDALLDDEAILGKLRSDAQKMQQLNAQNANDSKFGQRK
jgi:hypothetical protein